MYFGFWFLQSLERKISESFSVPTSSWLHLSPFEDNKYIKNHFFLSQYEGKIFAYAAIPYFALPDTVGLD